MTREEAITAAVRDWWSHFNLNLAECDARRVGVAEAIARQEIFVRLVRTTFMNHYRRMIA